jgi:hypothetical protein
VRYQTLHFYMGKTNGILVLTWLCSEQSGNTMAQNIHCEPQRSIFRKQWYTVHRLMVYNIRQDNGHTQLSTSTQQYVHLFIYKALTTCFDLLTGHLQFVVW